MGLNFQKNVLDLQYSHNELGFDLDYELEGHMKVKDIFWKFNPIFNSKFDLKIKNWNPKVILDNQFDLEVLKVKFNHYKHSTLYQDIF